MMRVLGRYHVPCWAVPRTVWNGTTYRAMWPSSWANDDFNKTMGFLRNSISLRSISFLRSPCKILTVKVAPATLNLGTLTTTDEQVSMLP